MDAVLSEPTVINRENLFRLVDLLLDVGEGMLCSGAEINRIEEALAKIGTAYRLASLNVFVIPEVITVTARLNDGFELTQTRRVQQKKISVNFYRVEKLNDISHLCRKNQLTLDELEKLIRDSEKPVGFFGYLAGGILAASAFTVFFGGTVLDALISAVLAVVVCLLQRKVFSFLSNRIVFNFVCAIVIGFLAGLISKTVLPFNTDKVLIGNIMLLIPGVSLTVSVRDIFMEDTISGLLRLVESLFLTGGLALGILVTFLFWE